MNELLKTFLDKTTDGIGVCIMVLTLMLCTTAVLCAMFTSWTLEAYWKYHRPPVDEAVQRMCLPLYVEQLKAERKALEKMYTEAHWLCEKRSVRARQEELTRQLGYLAGAE